MKLRHCTLAALVAGTVVTLGQIAADAGTNRHATDHESGSAAGNPLEGGSGTPDVIVFKVSGFVNYEDTFSNVRAFSFGTTSCNIGTAPLTWLPNNNLHPVIAQNMFRLAPGANGHPRLEQIGQSWLKHGFCALDLEECGTCEGTGCVSLGVGCSDPYTAARNGSQNTAGPKYQVNATTGFFPYPPADPSYSGTLARRLQVAISDMLPSSNPGARWFAECQYIHPEDAADDAGESANNVSYRELSISDAGFVTGYVSDTVQTQPALSVWKDVDDAVVLHHVHLPDEGNYFVAGRAYDNGDGTWDYEYAVHNLDSDRSAGLVQVEVPESADVTDIGFHDVAYHSGDGVDGDFDGTDWPNARAGGVLTWNTTDVGIDDNANAIRWGTMYNFRFTANTGPVDGTVTVGHFKDGGPDGFEVTLPVPGLAGCPADVDGSGAVDSADLITMIAEWGDCPGCATDIDGDGDVDFDDVLLLLADWGPCP